MAILIVDKDGKDRRRFRQLLKSAGYQDTLGIDSAEEALMYLDECHYSAQRSESIDLVIMDLDIPEINGLEACRIIKSMDYLRDIPIILMTADTGIENLEKSFDAGATDFLHKPVKEVELLARVRAALKLREEMSRRRARELELLEVKQQLEQVNAELQRLSYLDGLTGIFNRRIFDDTMVKEWRRARREKSSIAVIMLDIDHFKNFNDTYGHLAGDQCLKEVALALQQAANRPGDMVARYGGEEFAVILPQTTLEGAACVGNKMRGSIEELDIPHSSSPAAAHVTISIGVAAMQPAVSQLPAEKLVELADQALYKAKHLGRNRVETADASTEVIAKKKLGKRSSGTIKE